MLLQDIAQFIATRSGFVLGTSLQFGHREQAAPDRCVLVAFNGGGQSFWDLRDREDRMVQILARSASYAEAFEDSMTVYNAIRGGIWSLPIVESGESYTAFVEALAIPQYLGPDEKGRHEWSTNFIFRIKDATA